MTRTEAPSNTARTVLVTGAGGFVCSQVALDLAQAGFDVVATDQSFDAPTAARLANLRRIEAPLASALAKDTSLRPFAVVHGAAITADPASIGLSAAGHLRCNMDMLTHCLDWAQDAGAARFVFLSSTGVFSADDGDQPLSELSDASARGPYAAAKKAGEIVTQAAADARFATLSLRLGNLFGPHETPRPTRPQVSLLAQMVSTARAGLIRLESPGNRRDWTWLPDIGRATATLLDDVPRAATPVLHCGNTLACSDLELATAICSHFPTARIEVDAKPGRIKGPMASAVTSALTGFDWTPLPSALSVLLSGGVAA